MDENLKIIDKIIDDDRIKDSVRDNLLKEKEFYISSLSPKDEKYKQEQKPD